METIQDLFYFLNESCFIEKVNDFIEKFRHVKQRLVIDFEDYNVSKLIQVLNINDDVNISIVTVDFQGVLDRVNSLRENILNLGSFEHFVDTNHPEN